MQCFSNSFLVFNYLKLQYLSSLALFKLENKIDSQTQDLFSAIQIWFWFSILPFTAQERQITRIFMRYLYLPNVGFTVY